MTSAGPMTSAKADESDSEDQVLAAGLGQRARSVSEKPAGRSESEVDGPPVVYTGGVNGGADYGGAVVMQPVGYVDDNAPLDYPGSQPRRLIDLQEAAEDEEENEDEEDEEETDDEET